ncbi:sporulation protein [Pseudomonas sp. J237]|nr:SPOR domain-containing protein [Pseudomonas sp. J237]OEO23591.1 sporulation protein [Pseudomonas sp. J237]
MRWLFLLLLVLNAFYYVWHQQQVPLRAKEVLPLAVVQQSDRAIRLLSESETQLRREAPPAAQEPEEACLFLGKFDQEADAAQVEQRLLSLDIRSATQAVEGQAGQDYWVYLPPLGNRDASLRLLRELQGRKIDSFLISEGELNNGISLGIYPRRDSAQSVMQRLSDAGYQPQLKEMPRASRSYWVRIAPEGRRLLDDQLLQKLAFDFNGLEHQIMPCKGVASQR